MSLTDPDRLLRVYRDPVALSGLIADLLPIYAVLVLGWGAAPLVFLYWIENIIIGATTLLRMLVNGALGGVGSMVAAVFMGAFFTVHYGLFCFVHGLFLASFTGMSEGSELPGFPTPGGLLADFLTSAPGMGIIAATLLAWHIFSAIEEIRFAGREGVMEVMFSPYGRVVVLHIGLFAGFGALMAIGDPLLGVLGLILLDVAWGIFLAVRRDRSRRQTDVRS